MRKIVQAVILSASFTNLAWAQYGDVGQTKEHSFQVGLETSYIEYTESSLDVEESGAMAGIYGIYDGRPSVWQDSIINVVHLDAHLNYGQVDYKGSGEINNIDDYMFEPKIWIGKDFPLSGATRVTPYVGFGYRFLFDDLGGKISSTGAVGYDRLSQYIYLPVGFQLAVQAGQGWQLGFNAEYDFFIHGWQTSYLSNISGFPDITNQQDKGYGLRASFDIAKAMNNFNFVISPYVRFWHIDDSDTATATGSLFQVSGYEPENKSTEIGVRLGLQF